MKRVLLDTNIYGELVIDTELEEVKDCFERIKGEIVIYGLRLIRNELRATSKLSVLKGRNLRIALLSLYDYFTGKRELKSDNAELNQLSDDYYKRYLSFGGSKSKDVMLNDFLIVACASKNRLDIVVSGDEATMLTENAIKAYESANKEMELKTPSFIEYKEFKRLIRGDVQWHA